ncbi:MAG TPA: hypothetical protein VN256_08205 [Pyrinomonadaceae bacterium]|nr:hypothetical protein [Pyrinomonadaceae bacterium]
MNLFKLVNEQITGYGGRLTLSYQGAEVTVSSLHWNGIHCRDEQGGAVVVPGEWTYLKELFKELVIE